MDMDTTRAGRIITVGTDIAATVMGIITVLLDSCPEDLDGSGTAGEMAEVIVLDARRAGAPQRAPVFSIPTRSYPVALTSRHRRRDLFP